MSQLFFSLLTLNVVFGLVLNEFLLNRYRNDSIADISEQDEFQVCDINHCLNNGTCMQNETDISCMCSPSYYGAQCQCQLDLCSVLDYNCGSELKCISLCQLPACYCQREGFTADLTTKKCVDINECEILDICHEPNEICNNVPGSYVCNCLPGYVKNPITNLCIDLDECQLPEVCGLYGICQNSPGSFQCYCLSGFEGIPCEDYNECTGGMRTCEQICINTVGSYNCTCFEEFSMENDTCVYTGNASCALECGSGVCVENECVCNMGYQFNNTTLTCIDNNECEDNVCPENSICINLEGSFTCRCLEGFEMKMGNCIDINECSVPNRCGPGGVCVNYSANYTCYCLDGFELIDGICHEINECINDKGEEACLDINAKCINEINGYVCRCRPGFYMHNNFCIPAKTTMTGQLTLAKKFDMNLYNEISEVFRKLSNELEDLLTVLVANEFGQVHVLNFRPDRSTTVNYVVMTQSNLDNENFNNRLFASCQPYSAKANTCLLSSNIAIENYTLLQTSAMYFNACSPEYVDDYCPTFLADCLNLKNGQFKCICKSGFHMRARSNNIPLCIDVNECDETVHKCKNNQVCKNSFGSYSCDCIDGFYLSAEECLLLCNPNPCKNNGKCVITGKNDYACECSINFLGAHCELSNKPLMEATNLLYIISGVLVAILIVSILVGGICYRRVDKKSKMEVDRITQLFSKYYDNEAVN